MQSLVIIKIQSAALTTVPLHVVFITCMRDILFNPNLIFRELVIKILPMYGNVSVGFPRISHSFSTQY